MILTINNIQFKSMKKVSLLAFTLLYAALTYGQYFENPQTLTTGNNPLTVTVVDYNNDGLLDILSPTHDDKKMTIYINKGNRTYSDTTIYSNDGITCIATGDFNKDGKVDLALGSNWEYEISLLLGDGKNNSTNNIRIQTLDYFQSEDGLAVGDVDKDGIADLVFILPDVSNYYKIQFYKGDGAGLIDTITKSSLVNTFGKNKLTLADFNNDGYLDVAQTTVVVGGIDIYLFNPITKKFDFNASYPVAGSSRERIIHGDFNGDGKTDIAVSCTSNASISIIYGKNDGTFSTATNIMTSTPNFSNEGITALQLNNDSYSDFICVSDKNDSLLLYLSNSVGEYTESVVTTLSKGITNIVSADLDKDGYTDLIIPNSLNDQVDILYGKKHSTPTLSALITERNKIEIAQSNGNITITGVDDGTYVVSITTIDGNIFVSQQLNAINKQLTIHSELQTGMYILTIKGLGMVESKKIIIK